MWFVGNTDPWVWYKYLLAYKGEVFRVDIRGEGADEVSVKDIVEYCGKVYCGDFSMVVYRSLIFRMIFEIL